VKDKTDTNASQNLPVLELPQPEMPYSTSYSDHQHSHIGTGISGNLSLHSSPSIPLHATVSLKVKEKILANEFVDQSSVLNKQDELLNITVTKAGIQAVTPLQPRKFLSIEQWTDLFAVFAPVYRQRYPESAEPLAQYSNTIRSISKARGNWHYYDNQFRQLRQSHPLAWDSIHHELYIKALNQRQPFLSNGPQMGQSRQTCHKFNRDLDALDAPTHINGPIPPQSQPNTIRSNQANSSLEGINGPVKPNLS
jgi:hypothetical protein